MKKALLLIDIQNDFMPNGSLGVPFGNEIVSVVNNIIQKFDVIVATQDWHPKNHGSFASNHPGKKPFEQGSLAGLPQTLWPDHCIKGTKGAEFHSDLDTKPISAIFRKGTDPKIDSYSGFYDNAKRKSTGLKGYLKEKGITELYFTGLAADICVYYSIQDALEAGFNCIVIEDGVKALDLKKYQQQIKELKEKNVHFVSSTELEMN
ncbi:MAG: nicotinamidase/pyrazinamidase [Flavobacteriales bacterium]|nr:MAG: nicotinamidase/pyrazinamidase [Flavobacteriales bacterium]